MEEILGRAYVIIPERLRLSWEAFQQAVQTGRTEYGDRLVSLLGYQKTGGLCICRRGRTMVGTEDRPIAGIR